MMNKKFDELIKMAKETKNSPLVLKYGCQKLVQAIINELVQIKNNEKYVFSETVEDSIVDSFFWDNEFIQALWVFLEERDNKRRAPRS